MSATPSVPGSSPLTTPAETVPLAGQHIVVVGGGMTAHRFASRLRAQDPDGGWSLTVIGEERSEEHTSELQSRGHLVCRLLLEKKHNTAKKSKKNNAMTSRPMR